MNASTRASSWYQASGSSLALFRKQNFHKSEIVIFQRPAQVRSDVITSQDHEHNTLCERCTVSVRNLENKDED